MTWIEVTVQLVLFSLTFASVIYFRQPKKNNYLMDFEKEISGECPPCDCFCSSNKEATTETITQQKILTRIEKKTNQKVSKEFNRIRVKAKVDREINREELIAQCCYIFFGFFSVSFPFTSKDSAKKHVVHENENKPFLLLDKVGVGPLPPSTLSNSILILVDMQNEYTENGQVTLVGVNEALQQGKILLERARKLNTPVIHIVHHGEPGKGFFDPLGEGGKINELVAPIGDEPIVSKKFVSAFIGTNLLEEIQKTKRKELIVIGFMTHNCVSTLVRAAVEQYGLKCTVVADCTATRDLYLGNGQVIEAKHVQEGNLSGLRDMFASIVDTVDDIKDN
ncbi:hypothetical protein ABK040_015304 [Willaertia magna]